MFDSKGLTLSQCTQAEAALSPAVVQCWMNTRAVPANAIPLKTRRTVSGDEKTGMKKYPSPILSDCLDLLTLFTLCRSVSEPVIISYLFHIFLGCNGSDLASILVQL